jgi:DeoR family fructose operon transcriptional repressor
MPAPPTAFEVPFDERQEQALTEKRAIGALAATLVHEGDSIIIESGSTPLELARRLVEVPRLRVLTNSLAIALELAANPETEIDVLGGSLRRRSASLVGPWVADALCTVRVDIAFLGANGISVEFGLSSPNVFTAESRKAMIASARRRVVLADHTKLGVDTFHHVAGLDAVDVLVTDAGAEDAQVAPIRAAGVEVLVAK